jgi:hypothetical protein
MSLIEILRLAVLIQQLLRRRGDQNGLTASHMTRMGVKDNEAAEAMQLVAEIEPEFFGALFNGLANIFVRDNNDEEEIEILKKQNKILREQVNELEKAEIDR